MKRVVRKTATRPLPSSQDAPRVRYGRPATPAPPPAKIATRPAAKTGRRPAVSRPRIDVRGAVGSVRDRTSGSWATVAGGTGRGARATGRFVAARARTVAAWRLPHLDPRLASAVTGAVVGLVTVALGVLALAVFESIRGVSSGGGLWGGLTLLAIVALLGLFLDLADSWAAIVVLPLLGIVTFSLSAWLVEIAEHAPPVVD